MLLRDLIDGCLLGQMLDERYVSAQKHPTEPLEILNYTQRAQFDRVWNPVTRQCRGLIWNFETGQVVARPWPKFFNVGEHEEGTLDLEAPVRVTDKLDGSLGILYREPASGDWAIATRGSFTSEQALHGTDVLRDRYSAWLLNVGPVPGVTHLFEILYPQNRVVVDYADQDDLVLLGYCKVEANASYGPEWAEMTHPWPGPKALTFEYRTLTEALAAEPRPNAEGFVVHFVGAGAGDERVKLKQDDYVRLHRIVTGLNERTVWEHLRDGGTFTELVEPLPDEFHDWVRDVADRLTIRAGVIEYAAKTKYRELDARGLDRKAFAALANESEYRPYLFMLLDGKDPRPAIWKTLRPSFPKTLVDVSEAVA